MRHFVALNLPDIAAVYLNSWTKYVGDPISKKELVASFTLTVDANYLAIVDVTVFDYNVVPRFSCDPAGTLHELLEGSF